MPLELAVAREPAGSRWLAPPHQRPPRRRVAPARFDQMVKPHSVCPRSNRGRGPTGNKYKSSEIFGNSETRSEIRSENRSQYTQGDIFSSERSPRGNAFSGHPERSERAQHDWIL